MSVSDRKVATLLKKQNDALRVCCKTISSVGHPDSDAQVSLSANRRAGQSRRHSPHEGGYKKERTDRPI
ncbi:MAG: hypothetical protein OXC62_11180 [Aestuariivita sp.]|nr:hypothetical protein [Aestuariivita sp.]